MDFKMMKNSVSKAKARSAYERFVVDEGVPVIGGFGVHSLRDIPMAPWRRLGCDGAYLRFFGSDGIIGMYVGRITPGTSTLPERHLYEKLFYILQGQGVAEQQQRDQVPENLIWQSGSLFSPPLNTLHRLMNHSDQPALFLAVTTAPVAFDHYRDEEFIFQSDFAFKDRYGSRAEYLAPNNGHYLARHDRSWMQQANFVQDVRQIRRGVQTGRAGRINITRFEMSGNSLIGQLVEWPVGRYRKAHCRDSSVVLVILRSSGYSLMWPSTLGSQPYKNGLADQVVRLDWAPGSIFSPPPNWFHQHFNTGGEAAQTLAFYCGSQRFPLSRRSDGQSDALARKTGTLLEFDGGDPSIRRMYQAELIKNGISVEAKVVAAND